jgi:hypothetical protein
MMSLGQGERVGRPSFTQEVEQNRYAAALP